jgi:hypothetical protein
MKNTYKGFIVQDLKNKVDYEFKYIKGIPNVNVENEAIAKVMKDTGQARSNFWVSGFIKTTK